MVTDRDILLSGLQALEMVDNQELIDSLMAFLKLMEKWNKAYNLTSIRNRLDMVSLHLLDSLAVLPYLRGPRIVDIGTGAGMPGIPLAIGAPDMAFTLLDSNAKKTRFVQQAVLELKLKNVTVCHSRVENYQPGNKFNTVISRAFSSLRDFVRLTSHMVGEQGVMLAMKGLNPDNELAHMALHYTLIPIKVPGVDAKRCLIQIEK